MLNSGWFPMPAIPWRGPLPMTNLKADFWAGLHHIVIRGLTSPIPQLQLLFNFSNLSIFWDDFAPAFVQLEFHFRIPNRLSSSNFPAALDSKLRPGFLQPGCERLALGNAVS